MSSFKRLQAIYFKRNLPRFSNLIFITKYLLKNLLKTPRILTLPYHSVMKYVFSSLEICNSTFCVTLRKIITLLMLNLVKIISFSMVLLATKNMKYDFQRKIPL